MGYKAIAAGTKDQEAINHLEKQYKKKKEGWTSEEAIQTAITTLSSVIGTDFKSNEIEVGVSIEKERGQPAFFKKLKEDEIEHHLNIIADSA